MIQTNHITDGWKKKYKPPASRRLWHTLNQGKDAGRSLWGETGRKHDSKTCILIEKTFVHSIQSTVASPLFVIVFFGHDGNTKSSQEY